MSDFIKKYIEAIKSASHFGSLYKVHNEMFWDPVQQDCYACYCQHYIVYLFLSNEDRDASIDIVYNGKVIHTFDFVRPN